MCDKSYGRRDYLERHMKTHVETNGVDPDCILGVSEDSEVCSLAMSADDDEDMEPDDTHDVVTVVTTDD